jgi:hypothetical protein
MNTFSKFLDSVASSFSLFSNNLSGVGGEEDNAKSIRVNTRTTPLRTFEIIHLYKNGLVQKLIDTIPELALEAEIKINQKNNSSFDSTNIKDILEKIDILQLFCSATLSARLFREAYILIDVEDNLEISEPIDPQKIKNFNGCYLLEKDQLTSIFEKRKITSYRFNLTTSDVTNNTNTSVNVHPSRLLVFTGKELTPLMKEANRNENFSFLDTFIDSFSSLNNSVNVSANIIARFITFIFKMKGLKEILVSPESEELIRKRLKTHKVGLGSVGGLILDSETEEVEWVTANLSGIPETITKQEKLFTATSELPHDILWNEGSHSTASDLEAINTQRIVKRFLERNWKKPLQKLVDIIGYSYKQEGLFIDFILPEPILTLQERVNINKVVAETDAIYINSGVITPQEIKKIRYSNLENGLNTQLTDSRHKFTDAVTPIVAYTITTSDLENLVKRLGSDSPLLESFVLADEYTPDN